MSSNAVERVYEDIDPSSNLVSEQECDTLFIYPDGFKRDQMKVQLTKSGILRVSGERPLGDNKWMRFLKEFHIPPNCKTNEITAKFDNNVLTIRQPKLTNPLPLPSPSQPPPKQPSPSQPKNEGKHTEQSPTPQPQQVSPPAQPQPRAHESQHEETPKREEVGPLDEGKIGEVSKRRYRPAMIGCGDGLVRELMKPENVKMLAVSMMVVLMLWFYVVYMFKSLTGDEELSYLENFQEL